MSTAYTIGGNAFRVVYTATAISSWEYTASSTSIETAITGVSTWSSQVFKSTAATAHCYEQVFTQESDPNPETEDWFNTVTNITLNSDIYQPYCNSSFSFNGVEYNSTEFKASAFATGYVGGSQAPTPKFRLVTNYIDKYSARMPVDGYTELRWEGGTDQSATGEWASISVVAGHGNAAGAFSVAVYNPMFGGTRAEWAAGQLTSLGGRGAFSGAVQFRFNIPLTAEYTATSTSVQTASAVVTASAMSPEIMAREEGV